MIIYIDKTIGERCEKIGLTQNEELFFGQLAVAHQRGNCLLFGELDSIKQLCKKLSGPHAKLYRNVYGRYSEAKSIIDFVESVLVITSEGIPIVPTFIEGKQRILSLKEAVEKNVNSKCYLVGENLNDCAFYTVMAKRYLHKLPVRDVQVNFCNENGGGDTTNLVFKKCVMEDKRLTLCVADSDKKHGESTAYPNKPAKGETVRKLEKVYSELKSYKLDSICEVYGLEVHEVENLIPIPVLEKICTSGVPQMSDGIKILKKLLLFGLDEAVLCYDFKEGDKKIKEFPAMAYWLEVLEVINERNMPGICSSKLLEKALGIMRDDSGNITNFIASVTMDPYLDSRWKSIGTKVFTWGCCNKPSSS